MQFFSHPTQHGKAPVILDVLSYEDYLLGFFLRDVKLRRTLAHKDSPRELVGEGRVKTRHKVWNIDEFEDPRYVEDLMHVKSVEAQSLNVGMMGKVGE
ncbi:hypothetical protein TNCV_1692551 [Trichonephila clavipes]|nr:hypothetical protein TNCV_1692551 [Trichonephila clavipes]